MPVTAMISFRPRLEENTNDNTPIFSFVSVFIIKQIYNKQGTNGSVAKGRAYLE